MDINGIDYPVIGEARVEELGGIIVPIVDIPMMSDERWVEINQHTRTNRAQETAFYEKGWWF